MAVFSKQRGLVPMVFGFFVLLQAVMAGSHAAQHKHIERTPEAMAAHLEETTNLLNKRANYVKITGVPGGTVGTRLELRTLAQNKDAYNLFLLGLQSFMAMDKSDTLSFYQIAGVHGRPYVTWNNFPTPLVNQAGFCPHGWELFGSWHRPYLAVFEQAWYQNVQKVVDSFPEDQRQRWQNAANGLRWPYWDWAVAPPSGEESTPTLMRDAQVTVTTPTGTQTIDNPLFQYSWGSSLPDEMGGGPWNNNPFTLRRPVSNPTRSNNDEMASVLSSMRVNLRDRLYGLFMSGASWGDVSTEAYGVRTNQNGGNVDSIESIHDAIHSNTGGSSGGHMYYLDYAAFDPLFWLHHTQVDRVLTMYQHLTSTFVADGTVNRGMAQWDQGQPKNSYTPLKPFTKTDSGTGGNGDYFTSEDVRFTASLGYTYPETANNPSSQSVIDAINNLYGPNASSKKRAVGQYEGRPFRKGDYNTVLQIRANKYAMDGSYDVHCFVGGGNSSSTSSNPLGTAGPTAAAPTGASPTGISSHSNATSGFGGNSTLDYTSPYYVGSFSVLGMSKGDKNSSSPVMLEGSIPLTTCLQGKQAYGEIKSLGPEDVQSYLASNLYYKVIGPGGVEVPADQIPDFHVYVKTAPITPANSTYELPSIGSYTLLPKATENKPAGKPYTPSPAETSPPYPTGTMVLPWSNPADEPGYCITHQTIKYVDEAGNFLYQQSS